MSNLIDKIDEAIEYFEGFRLEELKEDDVYYINALINYIERLEAQVLTLKKQLK